jgi:hypothetical protein
MNPGVIVFPPSTIRLVPVPAQGSTSFSSPIATITPLRTAIADARGRCGSIVRIFAPVMSRSAGIAGTWANIASVAHTNTAGDMESFLNKSAKGYSIAHSIRFLARGLR